ncbi:MAG: DUF3187 family protein [Leptospiraceae bacterium]|nr:DUF3187 family protein [Leptospiraceae bacterium]
MIPGDFDEAETGLQVQRRRLAGIALFSAAGRLRLFSGTGLYFRTRILLRISFYAGAILVLCSQPAYAYIDYPYAATFQSIRMPALPRGAQRWREGEARIQFSAGWMNVWSIQSDRFILDGEEIRLNASMSYGLTDRFRIGVSAPYIIQGGGIFDHTIERFHSSFGITQGQRDRFPRNKFNASYEPLGPYYPYLMRLERLLLDQYSPRLYPRTRSDPPLNLILDPESAYISGTRPDYWPEDNLGAGNRSGHGELRFFLDYQVPIMADLGILFLDSAVFSVQLAEEGSSSVVAGNTGRSFSASAVLRSSEMEGAYWNLGLSYTVFERREFRLLQLPAQQWAVRPRIGYRMQGLDLFAEYVFLSRPVKDFGRLSDEGHQIALGFSRPVGSYRLEFAVIENLITYSTTPDIGLHISISRSL